MMNQRTPPPHTLSTVRLRDEVLRMQAAMKDAHPTITLNYSQARRYLNDLEAELAKRESR